MASDTNERENSSVLIFCGGTLSAAFLTLILFNVAEGIFPISMLIFSISMVIWGISKRVVVSKQSTLGSSKGAEK